MGNVGNSTIMLSKPGKFRKVNFGLRLHRLNYAPGIVLIFSMFFFRAWVRLQASWERWCAESNEYDVKGKKVLPPRTICIQ